MLETETKDILRFNAEGVKPIDMFMNAKLACLTAVEEFTAKHGEPMYCGFGNVRIKPARGRFVKYLKSIGVGGTQDWGGGGYRISYYDIMRGQPFGHTQSMDLKEIGCQAFADVLRNHSIKAFMESRPD